MQVVARGRSLGVLTPSQAIDPILWVDLRIAADRQLDVAARRLAWVKSVATFDAEPNRGNIQQDQNSEHQQRDQCIKHGHLSLVNPGRHNGTLTG